MYRPEDAYNIASALLSFWIDHRSRAASSPRSSPQHHNPKHTLTMPHIIELIATSPHAPAGHWDALPMRHDPGSPEADEQEWNYCCVQ